MTTDLFHSEGVFIAAPELKEKTQSASPIPDGYSGTVLVDASTLPEPVPEHIEPEPDPFWRQTVGIASISVMMLAIGIIGTWFLTSRLSLPSPPMGTFHLELEGDVRYQQISPNGTRLAYIKDNRIWTDGLCRRST